MDEPFNGDMSFLRTLAALPTGKAVLNECKWDIDFYNAPYLAGKANEPSYGLVELTADQAFGSAPVAELPKEWSESDEFAVVGDISHTLAVETDFIVVRTSDFKQAGELAEKMGYRPALAGEFLQLLWWLRLRSERYSGWFYCYSGRKAKYAILAEYNGHRKPASLRFIFDICIGDQVEKGYVSANADPHCFFVRKS